MIIKFFSALSMAAMLSGCNSVGNALTSIEVHYMTYSGCRTLLIMWRRWQAQ